MTFLDTAAPAAPAAPTAGAADTAPAVPAAGPALAVAGTHNFRSTAGYAAARGPVRTGGLLRSDALHALGAAGRLAFAEHGIGRVIDLRSADELRTAPSDLEPGAAEVVHHPIFEGSGLPETGAPPALVEVYAHIVDARAERLAGAVRLIADAPAGAVLVHCTAGKDRTGLVVAAALAAVGVSREQIVADYAASAANLAGEWAERMVANAERRFGPLDRVTRDLLVASPAEVLETTLDRIDERHGGVEAMLLAAGLDDGVLERLERRLVA